ncbi:MAG: 4Fe-4S binding protein [Acidobacteria bacterium]|nr:4Fe-4S binding protein [Acidobacteriota bacterium]
MASSTPSKEREKRLKKLAVLMNTRHQNPFPLSEELLSCLDIVLTPEEVDFLIEMGTDPYTYHQASSRSAVPDDRFQDFFEGILRKGYAWPHNTQDEAQWYKLPGFMLGAFEVFLADGRETPEKREFARRLDALLQSFGKLNKFPTRNFFNAQVRKSRPQQSILIPGSAPSIEDKGKTIAVGKDIDAEPARVYPARTVECLIEKHGDGSSIAVIHCFCRQYHKMVDIACRFDHPPQSCIAIGSLAGFAVRHGTGRYLSKAEAMDLVKELQSKGAVHQVFHQDEDIGNPEIAICNCCWDCCGVLGSYNRGIIPLNLHAFFEAQLPDESLCNGCAICADYCPVQAISIEDELCRIDREKCIGCGQCELQCSQEAIRMVENERTVFLPLVKKSEARIRD